MSYEDENGKSVFKENTILKFLLNKGWSLDDIEVLKRSSSYLI